MDYNTFKEKFNIELNDQQEAALTNIDGQTLLLAVPGSGKTTTLVCRIGYMIYVHGIDPSKILVLTFTRAAAADMRKRFAAIFGDEHKNRIRFNTINSICNQALDIYCRVRKLQKPALLDDNYLTLFRLYQTCYENYPAENDIKAMQLAITRAKNLRLTDDQIRKTVVDGTPLHPLYTAYQSHLKATGQMDYDDQLVFTYNNMTKDSSFLNYLQEMFPYILVDEAQDTSKIQHEIINLLAAKHRHLFMVGDEDQSIYGFRAAYPDALMQFSKAFPEAKVLKLERNYRSTPEIVSLSSFFIKQNRNRYRKNMFTERTSVNKVKFMKCRKREEQYQAIVRTLLPRYEGDTAVIYRNNESAIPLIVEMMKAGMLFRCRGMDTVFFNSRAVMDIKKIMQSALYPFDQELFMETYSLFNAHVSRKAAYAATKIANPGKHDSLWYALYYSNEVSKVYQPNVKTIAKELAAIKAENNAKDAIKRICKAGYKRADDDRIFILRTLAEEGETIEGFISRLGELEKTMPLASYDESIPYIFTTVHSSKGLEYDNVIIMDEISPIFPDVRADIEEERRLFYVAMTRARNNLTLLSYDNAVQPFIDYIEKKGSFSSGAGKGTRSGKQSEKQFCERSGEQSAKRTGMHIASRAIAETAAEIAKYKEGATVCHKTLGSGKIIQVSGDVATITFDRTGENKKYSIKVCIGLGIFTIK